MPAYPGANGWACWPHSAFSTYITNFLNSPSPGRSSQWAPQPGSARWRLDGAGGGQKAALVWDHSDLGLLDAVLFSMSWHTSRLLWLTDALAEVFFLAGWR